MWVKVNADSEFVVEILLASCEEAFGLFYTRIHTNFHELECLEGLLLPFGNPTSEFDFIYLFL